MKRNIVYLLLLLILGLLVYYFVFYKASGTLNRDEKNFSVSDTADISRIFIADMKGNKIDLLRSNNGWTVDNKFPTRVEAMNTMLSTLKNMAVRYPVPKAQMNTVIKDLSSNNKKIEIYDRKGNRVQSLYIGGSPIDDIGNFMLIEGGKSPCVVEVPGFQGSLETRFMTNEVEMRNHKIINVPLPALAQIEVKYLQQQDSSFAIDVTKPDSFAVYNPDIQFKISIPTSEINKEKVFDYLDFLKLVNCEGYDNDLRNKDSIIQAGPYCIITITKRNKDKEEIKLFHKPIDIRSKMQSDMNGHPLPYDIDHFYGLVNNDKDFVLLQQYHFGRLLRSLNYFRK